MQDAEILQAVDTLRRASKGKIRGVVICAVTDWNGNGQSEVLVAVRGLSDDNARLVLETASEITRDDIVELGRGDSH